MDRPGVVYNHPTDRAWAWVIVFAAGVANFVVNGGVRTIGLLIVELTDFFKSGQTITMVVTAFLAAGFSVFACVGNILGVRFTMRKVALAGATCACLGMMLTAVAPSIHVVIVTLGMLSGTGYGFLFGPSMVLVGQYCPKRMSIANGLAVAGGSIGQLVLPFFIVGVMKKYEFRGGILMYAGLLLHSIPAMLLLRPPSFYGIKKSRPLTAQVIENTGDNNNASPPGVSQEGSTVQVTPYQPSSTSYSLRDGMIQEMPVEQCRSANSPFFNPPLNYRLPSGIDGRDLYGMDPEFYRRASMSVPHTRQEVADELQIPEQQVTTKITARVFFKKCCDPVLLKNPVFIIYVVGLSLGHSGFIGACTCVAPYVSFLFGSRNAGATVIFVMGLGDLIGRCGGGAIAQLGFFRKSSLVGGSFVISGFLAMILPFFGRNMTAVLIFGGLFGLLGGTYMAQLVAMADDLFGSALLASSLGLSTMIMGLFAIPIIPSLGSLASRPPPMLPDYGVSVRVAGVIVIIGGIFFYLIPLIGWYKARRQGTPVDNVDAQSPDAKPTNGTLDRPAQTSAQPTAGPYRPAQYQLNQPYYPTQGPPTGYQPGYPPMQHRDGYNSLPREANTLQYPQPYSQPRQGELPPRSPDASAEEPYLQSSMSRQLPIDFRMYPPGSSTQFMAPGDQSRMSEQAFRWSKIPNSPESNL